MKLSSRIQRVEPSPTLAITSKAKAMIADGKDVVSFGAGEPDFDTPKPIRDAAKRALDEGKTRYTPAAGLKELRTAIASDYAQRGRTVEWNEVLVSVGGKHALYNATQVVFEAGDKIAIPSPYWVSYPAQVRLADAEPIVVDAGIDTGFKLTPAALESALQDPTVKGLILCSPSNPTGAVYTADELKALGAVIGDRDIVIFFDAMYDRLYFDGSFAPDFVACNPNLADRTLTFNGFSKTYAMTGWRLGYTIGPKNIIAQMAKLQSQSTSNPTTFAQHGAIEALKLPEADIAAMRTIFARRRDLIVNGLNAIDGVNCLTPGGAFYVFPDFNAFIGNGKRFANDLELATHLLENAGVAVVHGSAFGAPGHARLSYATSDALIEDGIARIAKALA